MAQMSVMNQQMLHMQQVIMQQQVQPALSSTRTDVKQLIEALPQIRMASMIKGHRGEVRTRSCPNLWESGAACPVSTALIGCVGDQGEVRTWPCPKPSLGFVHEIGCLLLQLPTHPQPPSSPSSPFPSPMGLLLPLLPVPLIHVAPCSQDSVPAAASMRSTNVRDLRQLTTCR